MHKIIAMTIVAMPIISGCHHTRMSEFADFRSENKRITTELRATVQELQIVSEQRDSERDRADRLQEQLDGATIQLHDLGGSTFVDIHEDHVSIDGLAFRSGSAHLTTEAVASIKRLAQQLNVGNYRHRQIVIMGHTDNEPMRNRVNRDKFGDNWGLSAMRAASVVRVFVESGISARRIQGAFAGQHRPRHSNVDKLGRQRNRRVEIFLR